MARPPQLDEQRLALVLSGGGVRALAEVGVLQVMAEYGLEPDLVVGTSGGAIVAALYAGGWAAEEIARLAWQWRGKGRRLLDPNWSGLLRAIFRLSFGPFSGLVKGERLEALFASCLNHGDQFQTLSRREAHRKPLFLTTVDLEDGEPVVFCDPAQVRAERDPETGDYEGYRICGRVPVSRAVRASISIPGVFVPTPCLPVCPEQARCQGGVAVSGDRYVDGGVREFLPLTVAVRLARAGLALGVNLGYAGLRREGVSERGIAEVVSQSLDIMGLDQFEESLRDELVAQARVVVLNPMIYDVGTFELDLAPRLIARGERLARAFFSARGLVPGGDPAENRRRLFPAAPGAVLFPEKGSDAYFDWLAQLKDDHGRPRPTIRRQALRRRRPARRGQA